MLRLSRSKVVFNVSAPMKILIDSVFNNLAISLRASLIVSQPVRLNLTNAVHLHSECISTRICVVGSTAEFNKMSEFNQISENMQKCSLLTNL